MAEGRKIYRSVTLSMLTGETLHEDSFWYEGPLALCDEPPEPLVPGPAEPPEPPASPEPPEPSEPPPPPTPQHKYKSHEEAEAAYKELERKLGSQGREFGEKLKTYEQLVTKLAQPQNGIPPKPEPPKEDAAPPEPKIEDFSDVDAFDRATRRWTINVAKWEMRQDAKTEQAKTQTLTQQERQAQQVREIIETHNTRIEKAAKDDPGLKDIIAEIDYVSDPMAWAIRKSEDGPKVIRFLYEHPEERQRIYNIAPTVSLQDGRIIPVPGKLFDYITAMVEMGRIIERIHNQPEVKTKKRSEAPEPHVPAGGNKGAPASEDDSALAKTNPDAYLKKHFPDLARK